MQVFRLMVCILSLTCCHWTLADNYYSLGSDKETLGMGFVSDLAIPLNPCVTGDWVFHGNTNGELAYSQSMDSNQMMNSVTGSIKGSVNLILFGGSAKYSMRKKVTENSNTVGSVMRLSYISGVHSLENRRLTDSAQNLLQQNPAGLTEHCGDGFIHSLTKGANLYLSAKMHFRNRDEYEWYQTKVKVRVLFFSKTITRTKEFREATKNAVYSIQLNTDGGLTPHLQSLGTSRYCRGTDISACIDYADSLFAYLLSGGKYAADLKPEHLKPIEFNVAGYGESGHMALMPLSKHQFPANYRKVSGRLRGYQDLVNDELEKLTAFLAVATDAERPSLTESLARRQNEIAALNSAGDYCATLPGLNLCEQQVEAAIANVH